MAHSVQFSVYGNGRSIKMAFNITVPWKHHLSGGGSGKPTRRNWWSRLKYRDDTGTHPTLMKEQDLDHLGTLHDAAPHTKRR
jgi:hypothetical protein